MQQCVVIADFSALYHRAKSVALKSPPDLDLKDVTIDNFVASLRTFKRELAKVKIGGYDLVFVEDRPAKRKLELLPTYRKSHVDTHLEKEDVKQHLLQNGHITRFCFSHDNEADDVAASVCKLALEQPDIIIILATMDMDWWQLIQPRVSVFNPIKKEFVTDEMVEEKFKCRPIHIPLFKSLWGDAGDCVPNVMPYTKRQLLPIVRKTDGRLETFHSMIEIEKYYLTDKCYSTYLEVKNDIDRNFFLVKLDDSCELVWN